MKVFIQKTNTMSAVCTPQVWIFGGIDTTTKDVFIAPVLRRNAYLLIPIIQRYIPPGTTVINDLWSGYRRLNEFGYTHLTVNHSQNFVDPQTGANTNAIESLWSKVKYPNKKECRTSRKLIVTYLSEYKRRRIFGADPFTNIVRDIRSLYVLCDFANPLPPEREISNVYTLQTVKFIVTFDYEYYNVFRFSIPVEK